jgi:ADP-heptose:LPS heptosyltransferase
LTRPGDGADRPRILFITATRIGDCILSTGLLGALLDRHPGARVTIACGEPAASLFLDLPGLERIVAMRKRRLLGHWLALWREVCAKRWDVAVDLRGSLTTAFVRRGVAIVDRRRDPGLHRVAEIGRLSGIDPPPAPRLWLSPTRRARAAASLPADAPVLALAPASNWPPKTWSADRFADLALRLTAPGAPLADARIVVAASPSERPQFAGLLSRLPAGRVLDLTGGGELLDVAACFARASLFVGNDSGLMHLAAAAGAPTIGLFGPSDERRYAPWGPAARAVRARESAAELIDRALRGARGQGELMVGLDVDAVEAAARDLLAAQPAR